MFLLCSSVVGFRADGDLKAAARGPKAFFVPYA
jgi:hypothetical protein